MLCLKKTVLALMLTGSSTVFAGAMGPVCTPGDVSVPCAQMAWEVGGQALYLQSLYNKDFNFAPSAYGEYPNLSGRWSWGFELDAAYHFNTGNDVSFSWYHLDTSTARFLASVQEGTRPANQLALSTQNRWDAVNGELGQVVDFGMNRTMRFHGGFQFAHIKPTITAASRTVAYELNSQYNGFGPRTGLDMHYELGSGLGVYAKAGTALLVGSSKFDLEVSRASSLPNGGSKTAIVPELDAKLGAHYVYAMARGSVTLDAGYMWFNYFNAFSNVKVLSLSRTIGTSDYGASGPYFGLKYVGLV
ncbi:MAG: Lpg1974 family pore-forming outer membrane protein [Legionella sp.]|uniref:Lpg1974 family pore-forming outer membrane protein n=1 Tax=Legionella sp. TaxID=459 RepID=UPI00284C20E4|nr:Lpg1974 family pore-forming outer membrane protein [Legionella sp.]